MKIAVIGCGVMGSAFATEFAKQGHDLTLCDRNQERTQQLAGQIGATYREDPRLACEHADLVLLAIKPKDLVSIAVSAGKLEGKILVSMLMGVSLEMLSLHFTSTILVRCMPNLAVSCNQGVTAFVRDPLLEKEHVQIIDDLFGPLGLIFWTEEAKIDAITALAGSGPSFVIGVIEAMVEGGIRMGLRSDEAKELALATILGAVGLLYEEPGHPGAVRWKICAPGGSTIAGMEAFEKAGVRSGMMETLLAAFRRVKGER